MIAAVDFETYYSKTHGVQNFGPVGYAQHPDTDVYMVSIVTDSGLEWVGDPCAEDCPWREIAGHTWVSHNRSFDRAVFDALRPPDDFYPSVWECTADLVAYLGVRRDLKASSEILLGAKVDKAPRDKMKGKQWADLSPKQQEEMRVYALEDSRNCLALWLGFSNQWPEWERRLSRQTTAMTHRGVCVDLPAIESSIKDLEGKIAENGKSIPWFNATDEKGRPIPLTSTKKVASYCEEQGIEAPKSMAQDSPAFDAWLEKYGEAHPFARAFGVHRSLNRTLEILKKMRDFSWKGRMRYGLKYMGAHTGRWSGDSGLNLHNFPRADKGGVDLRGMIVPAPGHVFLNADYPQIEARFSLWVAEDEKQLDMIRGGMDVYEAHARATMGYDDPRPMSEGDPNGRQLAKMRVLGLGYGCGGPKFATIANQWGFPISPKEATRIVKDFRSSNRLIVQWWTKLQNSLKLSRGSDFTLTLPSGREKTYYGVTAVRGWRAEMVRGAGQRYVYGGLLFENLIQAIARDLLGFHLLLLEDAGLTPVLHVHDEFLFEVPEEKAEATTRVLKTILTTLPDWAEGLPIEADVKQLAKYTK